MKASSARISELLKKYKEGNYSNEEWEELVALSALSEDPQVLDDLIQQETNHFETASGSAFPDINEVKAEYVYNKIIASTRDNGAPVIRTIFSRAKYVIPAAAALILAFAGVWWWNVQQPDVVRTGN